MKTVGSGQCRHCRRVSQEEGTVSAKAQRQDCTWIFQEQQEVSVAAAETVKE